jgi:hypothetical protein
VFDQKRFSQNQEIMKHDAEDAQRSLCMIIDPLFRKAIWQFDATLTLVTPATV